MLDGTEQSCCASCHQEALHIISQINRNNGGCANAIGPSRIHSCDSTHFVFSFEVFPTDQRQRAVLFILCILQTPWCFLFFGLLASLSRMWPCWHHPPRPDAMTSEASSPIAPVGTSADEFSSPGPPCKTPARVTWHHARLLCLLTAALFLPSSPMLESC